MMNNLVLFQVDRFASTNDRNTVANSLRNINVNGNRTIINRGSFGLMTNFSHAVNLNMNFRACVFRVNSNSGDPSQMPSFYSSVLKKVLWKRLQEYLKESMFDTISKIDAWMAHEVYTQGILFMSCLALGIDDVILEHRVTRGEIDLVFKQTTDAGEEVLIPVELKKTTSQGTNFRQDFLKLYDFINSDNISHSDFGFLIIFGPTTHRKADVRKQLEGYVKYAAKKRQSYAELEKACKLKYTYLKKLIDHTSPFAFHVILVQKQL